MKTTLINVVIHTALTVFIYLDTYFGIEPAGNIAVFCIWAFVITGICYLLQDQKTTPSKKLSTQEITIAISRGLLILSLIAVGWTFTAICLLAVTLLFYGKRQLDAEEHDKNTKGSHT